MLKNGKCYGGFCYWLPKIQTHYHRKDPLNTADNIENETAKLKEIKQQEELLQNENNRLN